MLPFPTADVIVDKPVVFVGSALSETWGSDVFHIYARYVSGGQSGGLALNEWIHERCLGTMDDQLTKEKNS